MVVKGVFGSADVARWIEECDRLWASVSDNRSDPAPAMARARQVAAQTHECLQQARDQDRTRNQDSLRAEAKDDNLKSGGEIPDRMDPVLDISPVFEVLAGDPRLVAAVGSLLDGTAIPFKAKMIIKRPGTKGFRLHQDYAYWEWLGLGPEEYINATIAFDSFDASNGTVEFFSGRQHERVPAPPGSPYDADEAFLQGSRSALLELAPGDVVLFHSMLPHRSGPNRGTRSRRGLFLTYVPSRHRGLSERYELGRVDRPR